MDQPQPLQDSKRMLPLCVLVHLEVELSPTGGDLNTTVVNQPGFDP
jgi:hypothetical protein